jgi:hypothetical protein
MVAPGASAEIRYSDDCRIPVRPGSVEVVARLSPCRPPPIVTAIQGGTLLGADPNTFVRSQLLRDTRDSFSNIESPPRAWDRAAAGFMACNMQARTGFKCQYDFSRKIGLNHYKPTILLHQHTIKNSLVHYGIGAT